MTHCLNHYPLWVPNTLESPLILIRILSPQKWTKVTGGCGQEEINSISVWRYPHDLSQLRLVILTSVQYFFHRLSSSVSLSCVCGRCFLRITNSDVPDKKQQDQKRSNTSLFLFLLCRHERSVFTAYGKSPFLAEIPFRRNCTTVQHFCPPCWLKEQGNIYLRAQQNSSTQENRKIM